MRIVAPWRRGKAERSFKNKFWLRVFWILFFAGFGGIEAFVFKDEIFNILLAPADGKLSPPIEGFDGKPVYISPVGIMMATITLAIKLGTLVATPVILYSVLSLVRPWLPFRFWRFLVFLVLDVAVSYLLAILFVYHVMMPIGLGFLLGRFGSESAVALIDIGEYLAMLFALMSAMTVVFMIPTIMFLITKVFRFPKYRHWKWLRWAVPVFASLMGIFLTPTVDGMNFLLVSLPVLGLYEVGLFATWLIDPEDGNYMWFKSLWGLLRSLRDAIVWFLLRPLVGYRKVMRFLLKHGIG